MSRAQQLIEEICEGIGIGDVVEISQKVDLVAALKREGERAQGMLININPRYGRCKGFVMPRKTLKPGIAGFPYAGSKVSGLRVSLPFKSDPLMTGFAVTIPLEFITKRDEKWFYQQVKKHK